jgi:hypothetical protein
MDIRLLGANPNPEAALNHRTGTDITRAFFDAHLRWGEQKNWSRFAIAPGPGIAVEKLGIGPAGSAD